MLVFLSRLFIHPLRAFDCVFLLFFVQPGFLSNRRNSIERLSVVYLSKLIKVTSGAKMLMRACVRMFWNSRTFRSESQDSQRLASCRGVALPLLQAREVAQLLRWTATAVRTLAAWCLLNVRKVSIAWQYSELLLEVQSSSLAVLMHALAKAEADT